MSRLLALAAFVLALPCMAQEYPSAPVRFVVNFPPGGGVDLMGRVVGNALSRRIGTVAAHGHLKLRAGGREIYSVSRVDLHRAWSETTFQMQRLRDNPQCAQQEYDRLLDMQIGRAHV